MLNSLLKKVTEANKATDSEKHELPENVALPLKTMEALDDLEDLMKTNEVYKNNIVCIIIDIYELERIWSECTLFVLSISLTFESAMQYERENVIHPFCEVKKNNIHRLFQPFGSLSL